MRLAWIIFVGGMLLAGMGCAAGEESYEYERRVEGGYYDHGDDAWRYEPAYGDVTVYESRGTYRRDPYPYGYPYHYGGPYYGGGRYRKHRPDTDYRDRNEHDRTRDRERDRDQQRDDRRIVDPDARYRDRQERPIERIDAVDRPRDTAADVERTRQRDADRARQRDQQRNDASRDLPREGQRESSRESPRESPRERSHESAKESPRETPRDPRIHRAPPPDSGRVDPRTSRPDRSADSGERARKR
jgi:hypothetical protein